MQKKPLFMLLLILTAAFPTFICAQDVNPAAIEETASESISLEKSENKVPEETTQPAVEKVLREPFFASSIENTHEKLKQIFHIWSSGSKTDLLLHGLILSENEDRFFRRSCEYLVRACREPAFSAAAAFIIFPRLLRIYSSLEQQSYKNVVSLFNESLNHKANDRLKILAELKKMNSLGSRIHEIGIMAAEEIRIRTARSLLLSNRRHQSGEIPDFLRKRNRQMIELIDQQLTAFCGLLNQLSHHNCLNQNILEYLNSVNNNLTGTLAAVKITGSLKSLRDFKQIQDNYLESSEIFTVKLADFFKNQQQTAEELSRKHSRNFLKISGLSGKFPERDSDIALTPSLDLQDFLSRFFSLLSDVKTVSESLNLKETAETAAGALSIEELEKSWGIFLHSKNWQNSELFKDFQTKEKDSDE